MEKSKLELNKKEYIASVFKTFDLSVNTLPERIAFQKTVYLLQKLGSPTNFSFIWHNFGPYSREVSQLGFSIGDADKFQAQIMNSPYFRKFVELKKGYKRDSKFLELMSDIIYIRENNKLIGEDNLFTELVNHQPYLNDWELFKTGLQRLRMFNLI